MRIHKFKLPGILLAALVLLGACSDSDNPKNKLEVSGSNVGIALDPYIMNARFVEVAKDGVTILQSDSTPSDTQGQFSFEKNITIGSMVRMQASARGEHGGYPYQGLLQRLVQAGEEGPFVVSPITTLLARGSSPAELLALFESTGLAGVQLEDLWRDPLPDLIDRPATVPAGALDLLWANMALGIYLQLLEIPEFTTQAGPAPGEFPYFVDIVQAVRTTFDPELFDELATAAGEGFSWQDMLDTAVRLNLAFVESFSSRLSNGQEPSGELIGALVTTVSATAPAVAEEVLQERTGATPADLPIAVADVLTAVEGSAALTGNLLDNDTPGIAPALVVAAEQGGNPLSLDTPNVTASGGELSLAVDGRYSYLPPRLGLVPATGDSETFTYTIQDDGGRTSSSLFTVTIDNTDQQPIAASDQITAVEGGTPVSGNLLDNDTPGIAPALVISAEQAGNPLSLDTPYVTTAGGELSLAADGRYSYLPPRLGLVPATGGSETFTYTIQDDGGRTSSSLFTVTIDNTDQQPIAASDQITAVEGGTPVSGNLLDNDTPGDLPTTLDSADQAGTSIILGEPFATAANGVLVLSADGSLSYTPPAGAVPSSGLNEEFSYRIVDSDGQTSSAGLSVSVLNRNLIPSALNDAATATEGGATVTGNLLDNDFAGDAPVRLTIADQAGETIPINEPFQTSAKGLLTLDADGSYSYTPPGLEVPVAGLTDTIDYVISDADDDSSRATLTIQILDNGLTPSTLSISGPARIAATRLFNRDVLLVSSYKDSVVDVYDQATLRRTDRLSVASRPTGVAFAFDRLFVGTGTGSVEVLDAYGQRLSFLGGKQGAFGRISDLAVDEGSGLIYILDSQNKTIVVYRANGTPAGYEIGNGILQQPAALAVDPNTGDLFVSDFGLPGDSAYLRTFNSAGNQLATIAGTTGGGMFGGTTRFSTPQGLYADGMGNLYMVDARSGEVQVYEIASGTQLYTLGSPGSGFEELFSPLDVYADPLSRNVYVTDQGNDRIMVFQEGGVIQ